MEENSSAGAPVLRGSPHPEGQSFAGKHTAGPWSVGPPDVVRVVSMEAGCRVTRWIAEMCNCPGIPAEERDANAHLIAAAPDLLEALKALVANVRDYERVNNLAPNSGRASCWDSVTRAETAIARAEGRPQ